MWIAPAGKLVFNTLPILLICLILVTDVKPKKPTIQAPTTTQTTMTSLSSLSHASVSDTPVVIILPVVLVLLLFAIVLCLLLKWKQKKDRSSPSHTDHLNNRELGHTADDYEEIEDYRFRADLRTVFNNVELPKDPSLSPTGLEHSPEDFEEIKDMKYHPEQCNDVNTNTEAPADPSDPPADPTQCHEYGTVNSWPNSLCSDPEIASSSVIEEI
ncbi:uncharacterized protein LOC128602326 isoform X1 [Ictalurus furcatus]|uniref:uncharacterized protein LOC128602326 isoform X1 n=1 Tax=Ictalurus furcatus TaxID=66913 RepID=UPI002350A0E9|nr:uncharacterized protein LOC128602326 isoform X1 [Ictalurus furcatus]